MFVNGEHMQNKHKEKRKTKRYKKYIPNIKNTALYNMGKMYKI